MSKVSHRAAGKTQPANSNFLLLHINTDQTSCPASLFLYFYFTHMFLFKASSAGYRDWCAPAPLSQLAVQRPFPSSCGGRPFLSTTLLVFHWETSPFFHSPHFSANCQRLVSFSIFFCQRISCRLSLRSWIPNRC